MTNHKTGAEAAVGYINHLQTKTTAREILMFFVVFVVVVTFVAVVYELQTGRAFLHSAVGSEREHNIIQKHENKTKNTHSK